MESPDPSLERLLRAAGEIPTEIPARSVPDSVRQSLHLQLDRLCPVQRILSKAEMKLAILQLLDQQGEEGFDIIKKIQEKSLSLDQPGEGLIYGLLNGMESDGLLQSRWRESGDRMIKSYSLTDKGGSHLGKHAHNLSPELQALLDSA